MDKTGTDCWCGNPASWYVKDGSLYYGCDHHPHPMTGWQRYGVEVDIRRYQHTWFNTVEDGFEYFSEAQLSDAVMRWNRKVAQHIKASRPRILCSKCGAGSQTRWTYCPFCGTPLPKENADED